MIVQTEKGAVDIGGATSVFTTPSLLSYLPKIAGLMLIVVGISVAYTLVHEFTRPGQPSGRWWEWLISAVMVIGFLFAFVSGGWAMLTSNDENDLRDKGLGMAIFLLLLSAGFSLLISATSHFNDEGGYGLFAGIGIIVVVGAIWGSRRFLGATDLTVVYPTHKTKISGLAHYNAANVVQSYAAQSGS